MDIENIFLSIALIGILGVGAQWIAWRYNMPAIVLMAIAGLLAGPVFGLLSPQETFGEFHKPIIALAVAVILFEGGLQLKFEEIRGTLRSGVFRLVFPGVPIAWALGAMAAYYIAGLSWSVSVLFAGILIVTGPTVIMPLLRQARLNQRSGALLKWEGIINDPIGALLAVIVYEYLTFEVHGHSTPQIIGSLVLGTTLAIIWGIILGRVVALSFRRGWVPEYLKQPALLVVVIVCFVVANLFQEEAGLLSVTAMGVTIANAKLPSINQLRHFKENVAVLFVSGVFIILTAGLSREVLMSVFSWQTVGFTAAMLFLVRPISIMISTAGAQLAMNERAILSWIAPRGIVAVAVSGFFAGALVDQGFEEAERMIPLAFAIVFATVVLHGFTIAPVGRWLGLASSKRPGIIVVGAHKWSLDFARALKDLDIPVILADDYWRSLRDARQAGIPTYYGEILSEATEHHLELNQYSFIVAMGFNDAHNSLVCTDLGPEMGRSATFQVAARASDAHHRQAVSHTLTGRVFMSSGPTLEELMQKQRDGWTFQKTRLTAEYPPEKYLADQNSAEILIIIRKMTVLIACEEIPLTPEVGDIVLAYVPPQVDVTNST